MAVALASALQPRRGADPLGIDSLQNHWDYSTPIDMKAVKIAELKARLSEYLRAVRRGETIAVLDRDTRVAELVPVRATNTLRVRKPAAGAPAPNRVPLPKPSASKIAATHTGVSHRFVL